MSKPISRRQFITGATATGGAALLAATAQAALAPASSSGDEAVPKSYRPSRAQLLDAYRRREEYWRFTRQPVLNARLTAHWFGDNNRFWYVRDLPNAGQEFILVDALKAAKAPAFDHARLAVALGEASGATYTAYQLPFDSFDFADDAKSIMFDAANSSWKCDLATYAVVKHVRKASDSETASGAANTDAPSPDIAAPPSNTPSPDGKYLAFTRDHNLFVRTNSNSHEAQLTFDGTEDHGYSDIAWSPSSNVFVAYRVQQIAIRPVYMIESTPKDGSTRGVLHQHEYAQAGDPFPIYTMLLCDPSNGALVPVNVDPIDLPTGAPDLHWSPDGSYFLFERPDRGQQWFRVIAVDSVNGQSHDVVHETTKTFINTSNSYVYYTKDLKEVIYASEQDGWRHLYRYDVAGGTLKNRITSGNWVVRAVDNVDEDKSAIWFQASGRNAGEDPYFINHYKVSFDGSDLVELTQGNGTHSVEYSPDKKFLVDTFSQVEVPPTHTLRRVADGTLVCELEKADASALSALGWRTPEVYCAKGRDGKTDIWGIVVRPLQFDPRKKYPIIENIYAGPQDSFVRKGFSVREPMQSLAELGFIVVQCDGMGTRNRSKAFHDVCWRNLKDAGLPDRIAWIKALAAKYPYCDTSRVGIYGTSAGGQSSTGAVLFHPQFYKVAVSSCGCHDNRIDKQWWNEQWMGYPPGPWYADNSNITHAANLRGKLLLFVGELDTNVPPEFTIRLTDALMKAGKDFELVVITGSDHTSGGPYGDRRRTDFFVRHLLGVEPPDRNIPAPPVKPVQLPSLPLSEQSLAQAEGGSDTSIEFHNETTQSVEIFWLGGATRRTSYGELAPGEVRQIHTYTGHSWLVTGTGGKPFALFVAESAPGIAHIRP